MSGKIINFIKYNNLALLIVLAVFLVSSGVFAATPAGQQLIGSRQTEISGIDNTLLLAADLDNFDMDYNIERIEQDEKYYYVVYTHLDLVLKNNAWQYQLIEKTRKINRKLKEDLGRYLANELSEQYKSRIKELKAAQNKARETGAQKRVEISEYSGLIGSTLNLAAKVFSNYEPAKKRAVPSPSKPDLLRAKRAEKDASPADNLTDIYNNYIKENDPDNDNIFSVDDNCPEVYNPEQKDADGDNIGDLCDNSDDNLFNTDATDNETATDTAASGPEGGQNKSGTTTEQTSGQDDDIDISQDQATDSQSITASGTDQSVEIIDLQSDQQPDQGSGNTEPQASASGTEDIVQ